MSKPTGKLKFAYDTIMAFEECIAEQSLRQRMPSYRQGSMRCVKSTRALRDSSPRLRQRLTA